MIFIDIKSKLKNRKIERLFKKLNKKKKEAADLKEQKLLFQRDIEEGKMDPYYQYFMPTSYYNIGIWVKRDVIKDMNHEIDYLNTEIYIINRKIGELLKNN